MTSLSDTQLVLLSGAAQRPSGSLLPLPTSLKPGGGIAKAITVLINRGLATERETTDPTAARRTDGNIDIGVFITTAGCAAIGIDVAPDVPAKSPAPDSPRASTKTAAVIVLLTRPGGATAAELIEATGWLPHTTRAALTGLRKKGHAISRGKRDGATCYHIVAAA